MIAMRLMAVPHLGIIKWGEIHFFGKRMPGGSWKVWTLPHCRTLPCQDQLMILAVRGMNHWIDGKSRGNHDKVSCNPVIFHLDGMDWWKIKRNESLDWCSTTILNGVYCSSFTSFWEWPTPALIGPPSDAGRSPSRMLNELSQALPLTISMSHQQDILVNSNQGQRYWVLIIKTRYRLSKTCKILVNSVIPRF